MKLFTIVFIFSCVLFFNFSCKPPRSPIADDRVRMIHRIDGENGSPDAKLPETDPAFQTDATRIDDKPKGFKRFFGKIFKKKAKSGPDENDLRVDINPNAVTSTGKTDSAKYNMDQVHYETIMRPSFGPEVTLAGKDPKQEYKGVPWWYPNKNPAVGYGYKPGYRYPGYKELSMDKRIKLMRKSAKKAKKYQKAQDKKLSKEERKAKKQALKDSLANVQGGQTVTGEGTPPKKKGLFGMFKKKKKEADPMDDIAVPNANKKQPLNNQPKQIEKKTEPVIKQEKINTDGGIDPPAKKEKKRKKKKEEVDPMADIAQPKQEKQVTEPNVKNEEPTKKEEKPKKKKRKKKDDSTPTDSLNTN